VYFYDGLKDEIKESTLLVEVLGFEVAGVEFGVNERSATANIGRGTKTKTTAVTLAITTKQQQYRSNT
jgi:hypothetical protein